MFDKLSMGFPIPYNFDIAQNAGLIQDLSLGNPRWTLGFVEKLDSFGANLIGEKARALKLLIYDVG